MEMTRRTSADNGANVSVAGDSDLKTVTELTFSKLSRYSKALVRIFDQWVPCGVEIHTSDSPEPCLNREIDVSLF